MIGSLTGFFKSQLDPAAAAFISAAGITNGTQISAINTLVIFLKNNNLWAGLQCIYPFVGGTASSHKYNLKDPRDLDAAFRLTFSGGLTHSANGVLPDGSTGLAGSHYIPNTNGALNSMHISYYSRTQSTGSYQEMGADNGNDSNMIMLVISTGGTGVYRHNSTSANYVTISQSVTTGFFLLNRIISTTVKVFKDGVNIINTALPSSAASTNQITIFKNDVTTPGYTNRQCAFCTIGAGLSDADQATLYTGIQAYQTSLGRQV